VTNLCGFFLIQLNRIKRGIKKGWMEARENYFIGNINNCTRRDGFS